MIELLGFLAALSIEEPRPAISVSGVEMFIESRRPQDAGPGKIVARAGGHFDNDFSADVLVVYTYESGATPADREHGLYVVAFFTENFETSDILFIPATDIIPASVRGYSSDGSELVIRGQRHLPGDEECCPSAIASIAVWVADGEVVILRGEYRRASGRD